MTYLEKFDKEFNKFGECNPPHCSNMVWRGDFEQLKQFITQILTQFAKEMVGEEMSSNKKDAYKYKRDFLYKFDSGYNQHRQHAIDIAKKYKLDV